MDDDIKKAEFSLPGIEDIEIPDDWEEQQEKRLQKIAREIVNESAKARLGEKFENCTFNNFKRNEKNKKAYQACWKFANGESDKGILLTGPVGIGKNHLAAAIVNKLAERGIVPLPYVTSAKKLQTRIYDAGREGSAEVAIENVLDRRYIVINDLGKESATSTSRSYMSDFIDQAYESERLLVITTNMTDAQIADDTVVNGYKTGYGLHVLSRLHEMCELVKYSDYDHRTHKAIQC